MLTPQEISDKVFVRAVFNGYDMSGVDDFLETVAADYAALYKENAILKGKIKVLVEKVEEYRSTEDSMRMALLTAQRMGEDIVADANKKSVEVLTRTDAEIRDKLIDMSDKLADEEARLKAAARETAKFVEVSQEIMRRHSEFLSKLDKIRRVTETPPPPPEPTREEKIAEAAHKIGNAVEKLTGEGKAAPPAAAETAQTGSGAQPETAVQSVPVQQAAAAQSAPAQPPVSEQPSATAPQPTAPVQPATPAPQQTAAPQPAPAQTNSDAPQNTAAVTEAAGTAPEKPEFEDEGEPTKLYVIKSGDDDGMTPRPKFDFENLKFGANYKEDD